MADKLFELRKIFSSLHREESGQDLIEYALIAALIALGAVAGMGFVAREINSALSLIGSKLVNSIS